MHVRLGHLDVDLRFEAGATVADLAAAAGLPPGAFPWPAPARLAALGLRRGDDLLGARLDPGTARRDVVVVGGLDAGRGGAGGIVGRSPGAQLPVDDPSVSRRHAVAAARPGRLAVADLGSRNGTWIVPPGAGPEVRVRGPVAVPEGATVRIGRSEVAAASRPDDEPSGWAAAAPTAAGTVAVNRPPRAGPDAPPAPAAVPDPVPDPPPPPSLAVAALVAPLVVSGVLVVVLGSAVYALFAALSPVAALAHHVESRRRRRRDERAATARRSRDLAAFTVALDDAVAAERARRLAESPDPAEVVRRALQPSTRRWERRLHHGDALRLRIGVADVAWHPPLDGDRRPRPPDVDAVVAARSVLHRCAATVDLAGGGIVGLVGDRAATLAVARSLVCQAVVHHGPADVGLHVATTAATACDWEWTKWLPHAATGDAEVPAGAGRGRLVVVDGDELLAGRRPAARTALAGASGIVLASRVDRLPSSCTAVVHVGADGTAELSLPATGARPVPVRAAGMAADTSLACALALAACDDPDLDVAGAGLPDLVRLLALLELEDPTAAAVADRWRAGGDDPRPVVPLGVDAEGVVLVDLTVDGPHALVAGTTGAGKSELLRTLVAGLAAGSSPEHLAFLLVDFKGGSAFDACARLPHVVGVVTDLDGDLAARALQCLDAELRHREAVLRASGATDLDEHRRRPGGAPLTRLVVVVDEFATLRAELPGFVDALVGVAQRGRGLGVHLVLATQRPAGAVSDAIRANTDLRVALRVLDARDSSDVVDVSDAARLPRHRPGRACLRLGPGETTVLQTALVTAHAPAGRRAPVTLAPFHRSPPVVAGAAPAPKRQAAVATDLDRLVDACVAAWQASGRPAPRRPWVDPLPGVLDRSEVPAGAAGLCDDPARQRRVPLAWDPARGNLAVAGVTGSGTTTTLLAAALALADLHPPDRLHLYAVDLGAGGLAALAGLPHTGAVVGAADRERQVRLLRRLRAELDHRRATPAAGRAAVALLVDGVAGFLAQFDDAAGLEVLDAFARVFVDGTDVGLHVAVAGERPGALPASLAAVTTHRWAHRLADGPALPPGRLVDGTSGLRAQVGRPAGGWGAAVETCAARWAGVVATAEPVGALPPSVALRHVAAVPACGAPAPGGDPMRLTVGVDGETLATAELALWEGEHLLVAGPARSGRTTALATIAAAATAAGARVLAVAGRRPWPAPLDTVAVDELASVAAGDGRLVVLVDDAETVEDPSGVLDRLTGRPPPGVHLVAAARADALRGLYGHWTRTVRRSRAGLLLRPQLDLDGELLGAVLPRRVAVPLVPGRGFAVTDGEARLVQVALPR